MVFRCSRKWSTERKQRIRLTLLILIAAGLATLAGCGGGDDDSSDDSGNLPPVDDTGGDDVTDDSTDDTAGDDTSDDDTAVQLESVEIAPHTRAIPQGFTKTFTATAHFSDGSSSSSEAFVFASGDEGILTVDNAGVATGVANGQATITVTLGDKSDTAQVIVGPDVFYFDALGGTLGAYDRATGTVVNDYLAAKDAIAVVPGHDDLGRQGLRGRERR